MTITMEFECNQHFEEPLKLDMIIFSISMGVTIYAFKRASNIFKGRAATIQIRPHESGPLNGNWALGGEGES